MDGLTIVISPLISLMSDQVRQLREVGINARFLNSTLSFYDQKNILFEIKNNELKFLYVSPERFKNKHFVDIIKNINVSQLVLDEAHSISMYGHDFRKEYSEIASFINVFKNKPVVSAFTATASQSVINDIKKASGIDFKVFKYGFDRKNLYYQTQESKDIFQDLVKIINEDSKRCMIIYCLTRRKCEEIFYKLKKLNFNVGLYHGGLDNEVKEYYEKLFMTDKLNIMVASAAFGTGINKSNIRLVVNVGFPMSLEDLSQQQGRAGRDGKSSKCVLLYNMHDIRDNEFFIDSIDDYDLPIEKKKILKKVKREKLREVVSYATTKRCLHEFLVSHFGELFMSFCNNCSNCLKKTKNIDYTYEARLIIDTIKLTKERYGSGIISKIIAGSKDVSIKSKYLYKLKTYNKTMCSINEIKEVISNLINDGYLDRTYDEYPILKLNENSEVIYNVDKYQIKV